MAVFLLLLSLSKVTRKCFVMSILINNENQQNNINDVTNRFLSTHDYIERYLLTFYFTSCIIESMKVF